LPDITHEEADKEGNINKKKITLNAVKTTYNDIPYALQWTNEEQTEGKKEKQKGKKRAKKEGMKEDIGRVNLSIAKIGDQLISDRLPPKSRYTVPVSKYYMNNRKIFIEKLAQIFKPYSDKIASKASELSCKTLHNQSINFELLTHQLIVRSYLNLYTPYRGLLLYHGLGSGKCHAKGTSILLADGSTKLVEDIRVGDFLMGDDETVEGYIYKKKYKNFNEYIIDTFDYIYNFDKFKD
jgi:hypothetical protein